MQLKGERAEKEEQSHLRQRRISTSSTHPMALQERHFTRLVQCSGSSTRHPVLIIAEIRRGHFESIQVGQPATSDARADRSHLQERRCEAGFITLERFCRFFGNPQREGMSTGTATRTGTGLSKGGSVAMESSIAAVVQKILRNKGHLKRAFQSPIAETACKRTGKRREISKRSSSLPAGPRLSAWTCRERSGMLS